jgi:hypothetical protein
LIGNKKNLAHMATGLIRFLRGQAYVWIIGTAMDAMFHQQIETKQLETKMNKIALSLVALAALSTASFASGNRSWDLRDAPTVTGHAVVGGSAGSVNAFAAAKSGSGLTAYQRALINQQINSSSSHSG